MINWKRLEIASALAIGLHLAAGLAMATILAPGLDTNPNILNRLSYLVQNRAVWIIGWLFWNFAALSILNFFVAFKGAHQKKNQHLLSLAVVITASAMACDLCAEAIEMGLVPRLAQNTLTAMQAERQASSASLEAFLAMHRIVVLVSGYAANGLYTIACAIATWTTRHHYPQWVTMCGIAVAVFGTGVSATAMADSPEGLLWSNALVVPCILIWQAGIMLDAKRQARSSAEPAPTENTQ